MRRAIPSAQRLGEVFATRVPPSEAPPTAKKELEAAVKGRPDFVLAALDLADVVK